ETEGTLGEPTQKQTQQDLHELRWRFVGPPAFAVVLGRAIQGDQYGQGPRPLGEGERDQHGQGDPLVPPTPSGVAVAAADRVAVPCLAIDLATGVGTDGVVADQHDCAGGPIASQQKARQEGGQTQARPVGLGQDTVVAGGSARSQVAEGAQQITDGASAGGQNGGDGEQLGPRESGRGGGRGKEGEHGQGIGGYTGHEGLLAWAHGWSGNPMIPHGRPSLVNYCLTRADGNNDKRTLPIDGKVKLRACPISPSPPPGERGWG